MVCLGTAGVWTWPRFTGPAVRPGPVPVPPGTPWARPVTATTPVPLMEVLSGLPLPSTTLVAGGPLPVLAAFIPGMPRAMFTGETAGPWRFEMGESAEPSRTALGCASLLGTEAACGLARSTCTGAATAITCLGAAGMLTIFGVSIFTIGLGCSIGLGTLMILGGSTLTICGSGFGLGGMTFG